LAVGTAKQSDGHAPPIKKCDPDEDQAHVIDLQELIILNWSVMAIKGTSAFLSRKRTQIEMLGACLHRHTLRTGDLNMFTKFILPALAAFLTVLSLHGTASARGHFSAANHHRFVRGHFSAANHHRFVRGHFSAANHYRFARGHFSVANDYSFKQTIKRFKARVPSDAFGSIGYQAGTPFGRSSTDVWSGVFFVGRDPDPNIRFQLLRDFR
jgi:hypothetical protein